MRKSQGESEVVGGKRGKSVEEREGAAGGRQGWGKCKKL